jgi:hypothetical protein
MEGKKPMQCRYLWKEKNSAMKTAMYREKQCSVDMHGKRNQVLLDIYDRRKPVQCRHLCKVENNAM